MKYLFNLFNMLSLTATIFFMVEMLYKYIDHSLMVSAYIPSASGEKDSGIKKISQSVKKPAAILSLKDYELIYKRDIFKTSGDVSKSENEQAISEKEIALLEKTNLKLKLWGTVTRGVNFKLVNYGEEFQDYAVIETDKDKKQALYKKGDEIEGAVIKKILRFSVILSRNGKDERLEITEENFFNKGGAFGKNGVDRAKGKTSDNSLSDANDEKIEMSIKRSLIDDSMKDINSLMNQVKVKPHFTSGNADGILLYGIKQSSMFKNMGIQNGDIIMGVDGTDIKSVDDAISLYDRLKNSPDVKMQIKRRGEVKEILYHVE